MLTYEFGFSYIDPEQGLMWETYWVETPTQMTREEVLSVWKELANEFKRFNFKKDGIRVYDTDRPPGEDEPF